VWFVAGGVTPTVTNTSAPTVPPTATLTPTPVCGVCITVSGGARKRNGKLGDVDCNNVVDLYDFGSWKNEFLRYRAGQTEEEWISDLDCDGDPTIYDFAIWRNNFIR
jgi:hypothetical protein